MDEGENVIYMAVTSDYSGFMLFFYENGKAAKTELSAYVTKTNRRKLTGAYSDKCGKCVSIHQMFDDNDIMLKSSASRLLLINSGVIYPKSKGVQGIQVMTLKKNQSVLWAKILTENMVKNPDYYRTKTLPALGRLAKGEDIGEQISMM